MNTKPFDPRAQRPGLRALTAVLLAAPLCSAFTGGGSGVGSGSGTAPGPGSASGSSAAADDVSALWKDPQFLKQFVAGYGINAEIEPRVTPDEVKVLEKIRPLMEENDLPAAEALLVKSIKKDSSAMLHFQLGSVRYQQEKTGLALESYTTALQKFPSFKRAWRNLGLIQAKAGNNEEAITAFTRMIALGGGDGYAYGLLGFAYAAEEDYQAAEVAYRSALLLQPENVEWRFGLTRCAFKQEKYQDAVALLDVLLERYPERGDFWWLQANALNGLKQPLRAAENLEMMNYLGKATLESLQALGDIYVNESLFGPALRAYLGAIELDTAQPVARPLRSAEVLTARGALAEARTLVNRIRTGWDGKLSEDERHKLLKLDARLTMAEGNAGPEVAAILEEIVKLDPLDGDALMLLGQHYDAHGEPDRAIFYYERAAGLEAFEANAKIRHANVLINLKRFDDALPLLRRAQEIKPREDLARYIEGIERSAKAHR